MRCRVGAQSADQINARYSASEVARWGPTRTFRGRSKTPHQHRRVVHDLGCITFGDRYVNASRFRDRGLAARSRCGPHARLIAALGTQRDRYHSASELQSYSGIVPSLSGRHFMSGPRTPSAPRPGPNPITSSGAPRTSREIRSSGLWLSNGFAFSFVAGKTANPYREDLYQRALAHRTQLAGKGSPVKFAWKTCTGFSKSLRLLLD
jgi:hypothetical protein